MKKGTREIQARTMGDIVDFSCSNISRHILFPLWILSLLWILVPPQKSSFKVCTRAESRSCKNCALTTWMLLHLPLWIQIETIKFMDKCSEIWRAWLYYLHQMRKKNAYKLASIFLFRLVRNTKVIFAIFMDPTKISCLNGSHSC